MRLKQTFIVLFVIIMCVGCNARTDQKVIESVVSEERQEEVMNTEEVKSVNPTESAVAVSETANNNIVIIVDGPVIVQADIPVENTEVNQEVLPLEPSGQSDNLDLEPSEENIVDDIDDLRDVLSQLAGYNLNETEFKKELLVRGVLYTSVMSEMETIRNYTVETKEGDIYKIDLEPNNFEVPKILDTNILCVEDIYNKIYEEYGKDEVDTINLQLYFDDSYGRMVYEGVVQLMLDYSQEITMGMRAESVKCFLYDAYTGEQPTVLE